MTMLNQVKLNKITTALRKNNTISKSALAATTFVPMLTAGGNYTVAFVIGASLAVIAMLSVWG